MNEQTIIKVDNRKFKTSEVVESEYDVDFIQAEIRSFEDAIDGYKKQLATQTIAVENTVKKYEEMIQQRKDMLQKAQEQGIDISEKEIPKEEPAIETVE